MTQDDLTQVCQWAELHIGWQRVQDGPAGQGAATEAYRTLSRVRLALGVGIPGNVAVDTGLHSKAVETAPVTSQPMSCTCPTYPTPTGMAIEPSALCPRHGDIRDTSLGTLT